MMHTEHLIPEQHQESVGDARVNYIKVESLHLHICLPYSLGAETRTPQKGPHKCLIQILII